MFDKTRYSGITLILNLELENLITADERDTIKKELGEKYEEVVYVSPEMAIENTTIYNSKNKIMKYGDLL